MQDTLRLWAVFLAILAGGLVANPNSAHAADPEAARYDEPFRPQLHFSPARQWMNDPNGLIYSNGRYHLFFQYNPYSNKWGPMHWGHATSTDLVHWQERPIALFPDVNGAIFSGSAVLDARNSSGFGTARHPPLIAMFTYHDHLKEKLGTSDYESQGLAYSRDDGLTWEKYSKNPVLHTRGSKDFRDPKLVRLSTARKWIVAVAAGDHVEFYSSGNLKSWHFESEFGAGLGSHVGVWECPDLLQVPIEGSATSRWVLLISVGKGGPNGGSATQYFVGTFDGQRFVATAAGRAGGDASGSAASARWLDYGPDDYAGSTWSGTEKLRHRPLFIGWMSNWDYASDVPTERWRSAMTVPRELALRDNDGELRLVMKPIPELAGLRAARHPIDVRTVVSEAEILGADSGQGEPFELDLVLDLQSTGMTSLSFLNSSGEAVVFGIDRVNRKYTLDRTRSGQVAFNPRFATIATAPIENTGTTFKVHAFVDRSSIEILLNDGECLFTLLVFPTATYNAVRINTDSPVTIRSGVAYTLSSSWVRMLHSAANP